MTYDIELPNPFWFKLNIIESEENLPSIMCYVALKLETLRGDFSYSSTGIWFECSVFDEFISQLKGLINGNHTKADFYDLNQELLYQVTLEEISVSIHRIHSERGSGYLEFKQANDLDLIAQHISRLESFAKWW